MKKITLIILVIMSSFFAQADSPLTSTNFYTVYEEYDIVQDALAAKGKLTNSIMLYLSDRSYPIDVKMAVINALGWNLKGKKNYETYLDFVEMRMGINRNQNSFYKKIDSDELICLAYIKAMDNYFDVKEAKKISALALAKTRRSQHSYTYHIIDALIGAQMAMDHDWCKVFKMADRVKNNNDLRYDFPEEAEVIIFEYLDLYKTECK